MSVRQDISMMIDRIGSIDPIQPGKKAGQNNKVATQTQTDSISLSAEAMEKGEIYKAMETVSSAADVRADRIAELKAKIDDPNYINDTVLRSTADKIMEAFGI
jgi:negative regulator of flagellin synthesis FlgM